MLLAWRADTRWQGQNSLPSVSCTHTPLSAALKPVVSGPLLYTLWARLWRCLSVRRVGPWRWLSVGSQMVWRSGHAAHRGQPFVKRATAAASFRATLDALSYIQPVCSPGSLPRSHSSTLPRCCLATSRRSRSEVRGRRACVCMCGRGEGDGVSRMTKTASAAAGPYIFRLAVYA